MIYSSFRSVSLQIHNLLNYSYNIEALQKNGRSHELKISNHHGWVLYLLIILLNKYNIIIIIYGSRIDLPVYLILNAKSNKSREVATSSYTLKAAPSLWLGFSQHYISMVQVTITCRILIGHLMTANLDSPVMFFFNNPLPLWSGYGLVLILHVFSIHTYYDVRHTFVKSLFSLFKLIFVIIMQIKKKRFVCRDVHAREKNAWDKSKAIGFFFLGHRPCDVTVFFVLFETA